MSDTTQNIQRPVIAARPARILIAVIEPQEPVRLQWTDNTLEAMQRLVGGRVERITVVENDDTLLGWCNDEFLFNGSPENRFNPATGQFIHGTFFVAGDCDGDMEHGCWSVSLTPAQVETITYLYGRVENRHLLGEL